MAAAGTVINQGAVTFLGGGTGLANILSLTAVSSAVGLGLAAYALTRPQESKGYKKPSSGYHKRKGLARQGGDSEGGHIVAINKNGELRSIKVSSDRIEGRTSTGRQGKISESRPQRTRLGKTGRPVTVGRQGKTLEDRPQSARQGKTSEDRPQSVRQGKNAGSRPSRPVKIIGGKLGTKVESQAKNRSKRDQQDISLGPLSVLQYEEELELDETLELIRQHDTAGCGKRLMCELGGMKQDELTIEELSILNLVSPNGTDIYGEAASQASLEYLEAKTRGEKGEKCGNVYPRCTLNGKQLMSIVMEYLP